ncbi:hypothetical protein GJ688_01855 [Heliobacillus mobilis]|uniref:Uncharacterized protein n=1 Tax=Heliobacterium mobile TaxID=28064 RepID=A0A6I3SFM1_HELMO|nr:hypothetical protein [Heliobacterium mobile]MTV47726.1 hypothetical protein [Heliobacterium mobile]
MDLEGTHEKRMAIPEGQVPEGLFSKKDLHCIARHIQEYVESLKEAREYSPNACQYCDYAISDSCTSSKGLLDPWPAFLKLSRITNVNISPCKSTTCVQEVQVPERLTTVEYDVRDLAKVWLTSDEAFYQMISIMEGAITLMTPEISEFCEVPFSNCYLIGIREDKRVSLSEEAR